MSSIIENLNWSFLASRLISIIPVLFCLTVHELAHGDAAYKLGDPTAKELGRLTLNPIKHIDPLGLIMMIYARFGWAKPVPVNMMNFKRPKRDMAITALAGPMSNIILAAIALFIFGLVYTPLGGGQASQGSAAGVAFEMIQQTAFLSIALAVFNMLPIPPLDGSKVLFSIVSDNVYNKLMQYERYGMILLMLILFVPYTSPYFSSFIYTAVGTILDGLYFIARAAFDLVN